MVYSSGSKMSRNQSSIVNRGNTCGGSMKSGLGYTGVGITKGTGNGTNFSRTTNTQFGDRCGYPMTMNPTQRRRGSYSATHAGVGV